MVLAPDAELRWVSFALTPGNQIVFSATLDGSPVTAILDTGASHSVLSRDYATKTARKIEQRGRIAAIGGAVAVGWTRVRSVSFGGVVQTGGGLSVVALPGNVTGHGQAIDMLVGRDMLDRYALDLDYVGRRFRLLPSGRLPFTGVRAPLRVGQALAAYITQITIAGRRLRPIIVDTGDGTALTLARSAWRTLPFTRQPMMTTQLAYGVGGAVIADIGTLPELLLGDQSASDVQVWVEQTGGFSDIAHSAGRIGSGLLQRYRVLLDPSAGHMVLAQNGASNTLPRSTSGLQLALSANELRVLHVMRGSPAAAGGWRVGDRICAVDGVAIVSDPAAAARSPWPFARPGTIVALKLCDGETRKLTLRQFY